MLSKLKMWQINLIGFLIALIVSLILFFVLVKPKNEQVEAMKTEVAGIQQAGGTASSVSTQQGEAKKQEIAARKVEADWKRSADYYMPTLTLGNDANSVFQAWEYNGYRDKDNGNKAYGIKDLPIVWGRWITAWYDAQKNQGVSLPPGMGFPVPAIGGNDPNYVANIKSLQFPQDGRPWPVTLTCRSFNDAMTHLRKINGMRHHGMPVIDNVALSGQSPNLQMNYNLALYVVTDKNPPPADPMLGTGGGATGSAPGGFGGGMPGFGGGMPGSFGGGGGPRPSGPPAGGSFGGSAGGSRGMKNAGD